MQNSIEIDLADGGNILYIFFGGISAGITMPPFEFYKASKILNHHKIFVRDFKQAWYHRGLLGETEDILSTAAFLKKHINAIGPDKVYFVGNSMGGFAAILFSALIGIGEVIAFSPQTFISPFLRLRHLDYRWHRQIINTYYLSLSKAKFFDLNKLLMESDKEVQASVYVSKNCRLDYLHALHIEDVPGITLYRFDDDSHDLVRLLRDQGKLVDIMSGTYN